MVFEIKGKVALVTGGAGGIGLSCVRALLNKGAKGVAILDLNGELGGKVVKELKKEYDSRAKIYFYKVDVGCRKEYEEALEKVVEQFKNLDIVINNAGILDDNNPTRTLAVNLNSVITGTHLCVEHYLQKYRSGPEGVVVNTASVAAIDPAAAGACPIYTATKAAVVGLSQSFGDDVHYKRTKVKVLTVCPGGTLTPIFKGFERKVLGEHYLKILTDLASGSKLQRPEDVASAVVKIIQKARTGTVWVAENGNEPYEYVAAAKDSCKNNILE